MTFMFEYFSGAASFVHLAVLCYMLGLLTRKELLLRGFLFLGSLFYILYYYYIAESPLWEAIAASTLIAASNLPVIYRIFRERSTFGMTDEMLTLYQSFPNFNPGQFRQMMAQAEIVEAHDDVTLLEQGMPPSHLYLTNTNGFVLERDHLQSDLGPGNFLGEISFLLGGGATATVKARAGASYVAWDLGQLQSMMANSSSMANAISVLLNKDIARKLAVSFPSKPFALPPTVT
ncbi:Cyclic nucleotide-binding domain protein [Sulfitobacter noctilucicola]|uniref:Cyclic nucleotide-binding domain-containing protein n=1 Tax=Sulfitobacter noctilucicola TaxID=1342301 RepID=A0A7W6MCS3_9RHOB|nr:cyclic nucleotide-binding domain-containing protein [Sulfitobacter noctilucicola]KIN66351.1 Cyclic nucleotide-binding domain protein [Sulfitobacter noctilucicola]MBB4175701.1 hypothetical protein [Sulfitobacter noctilucicola]